MYTTLTPVIGLFQKKQGEELRVEFPGLNKSNMEFSGVIKKEKHQMELPGVLVLGLKSSEGYNKILWSFWGKALFFLDFPGIKQKT